MCVCVHAIATLNSPPYTLSRHETGLVPKHLLATRETQKCILGTCFLHKKSTFSRPSVERRLICEGLDRNTTGTHCALTSFSRAFCIISCWVSATPFTLIHRNMPADGVCHSATSNTRSTREQRRKRTRVCFPTHIRISPRLSLSSVHLKQFLSLELHAECRGS